MHGVNKGVVSVHNDPYGDLFKEPRHSYAEGRGTGEEEGEGGQVTYSADGDSWPPLRRSGAVETAESENATLCLLLCFDFLKQPIDRKTHGGAVILDHRNV